MLIGAEVKWIADFGIQTLREKVPSEPAAISGNYGFSAGLYDL